VKGALRVASPVLGGILGAAAFLYVVLTGGDARRPAAPGAGAGDAAPVTTALPPRPDGGGPVDRTIRIGWTAWSDAEVVTNLARRVLEERLDCEVELVMADTGIQYQAVASGDLDVMLMAWLPTTHAAYWEKVGGEVLDLGPLYTGARLGWAVPDSVPEDVLGSIEDLRDPGVRRRLRRQVQGIDPGSGLMQASERALVAYGLEGEVELVSASGAAMTAALGRAIRRDEWIVVTAWSPHWMFAEWELRYLDDPRGVLGGRERVHALARPGFGEDAPPEVLDFFARLFVPMAELEEALLTANDASVDEAVAEYMAAHPVRIDYWVTGEVAPERR